MFQLMLVTEPGFRSEVPPQGSYHILETKVIRASEL